MNNKETFNTDEIEQALTTLSEMRSLIRGNMQILRPLFYDINFGILGLFTGIASGILCIALWGSSLIWNNYQDVPLLIQMIFVALCIGVLLAGIIGKIVVLDKAAKKSDIRLSFFSIFQFEEMTKIIMDAVICLIVTAAVCIIAGKESGNWWIFLPGMYMFFGIILLQTGSLFFINAYRIQGVISFALSIFLLLFMQSHFELWLSGSIAVFFTGFGIDIMIRNKYFSSSGKTNL